MAHPENNKRGRSFEPDNLELSEYNTKTKVPNLNKTKTYDFECHVFFREKVFDLQLSTIFKYANFAILFFCPCDFSPQSRVDLLHIQENYSKFLQVGAIPIAISHDRIQVHCAYATPNKTASSLSFVPSFLMASDHLDRLISTSFKSINLDTLEMIRSVVIIDSNLKIVFTHQVQNQRFFPMHAILNCFE